MVSLHWVSAIVMNESDRKPWLCSMTEGYTDFKTAMRVVEKLTSNYTVLTAWIELVDVENNKDIVFHECYL